MNNHLIIENLKNQGYEITGVGDDLLIIMRDGDTYSYDTVTAVIKPFVWKFI